MNSNQKTAVEAVYTAWKFHCMQLGDIVLIHRDGTRSTKFWRLFIRPWVTAVSKTTDTAFKIVYRRMTWKEWRQAVIAAFKIQLGV